MLRYAEPQESVQTCISLQQPRPY